MGVLCSSVEDDLLFSLQQQPNQFKQWAAFEQSLGRHIKAAARNSCLQYHGWIDEADVEDITQTVYLFLVDPKRPRFDPDRSSAKAYLMGIIGNAVQKVFPLCRTSTHTTKPGESRTSALWRRRRHGRSGKASASNSAAKTANKNRARREFLVLRKKGEREKEPVDPRFLPGASQNPYTQIENRELVDLLLAESDPLVCRVFWELSDNQEGERRVKDFRIEDLAAAHGLSRDQLNYRIRVARSQVKSRLLALGIDHTIALAA